MEALAAGISLSAKHEARAKADMKPSLTPWVLRIESLYSERKDWREDMSISLKVVREAADSWDCFSRLAMV
jgi:hypothetical protein